MRCYPLREAFYEFVKVYPQSIDVLLALDTKQKEYIFDSIDINQIREAYERMYGLTLNYQNQQLELYNKYTKKIEIYNFYPNYIEVSEQENRMIMLLQRLYPYLIIVDIK